MESRHTAELDHQRSLPEGSTLRSVSLPSSSVSIPPFSLSDSHPGENISPRSEHMSQVFPAMMHLRRNRGIVSNLAISSFLFLDFGSLELFQPSLELKSLPKSYSRSSNIENT